MLGSNCLEVLGQIGLGHRRQHRDPILVALAASDGQLVGGKVDVRARTTPAGRREA
jgi:hypothetical protein